MNDAAAESAPGRAGAEPMIRFDDWRGSRLSQGKAGGAALKDGVLAFNKVKGIRSVSGRKFEWAQWTSPKVEPGFGLTELIPSWNASTPGGSFVRIQVRGRTAAGDTGWDSVADWAATDASVRRTSFGAQAGGGASMNVDTWMVPSGAVEWQMRVILMRPVGSDAVPTLRSLGAVASRTGGATAAVSSPRDQARGVVLDVPAYSQMIHRGEYPQYGGGGNAWCSPTSTSMVLSYYGALPKKKAYAWVDQDLPDRFIAHAARSTFDWTYDGAGNWPFNTAYAGAHTDHGFVTRLADLRDVETFILAGIPVVISVAYDKGELDNSPIDDTAGHLLVVVGFTKSGDVVVNDPAAATNAGVRRTYKRAQLEKVWLEASDGVAYIIRDKAHPLPTSTKRW
ncbi:MAG: peptidase C39 family protein [Nocardioides sp.]